MFDSIGSVIENYIYCFIGINLIAIAILFIRKFAGNKLTKKFIYGMWLVIPVFILIYPFVKLPMPKLSSDIPVSVPVNKIISDITEQVEGKNGINLSVRSEMSQVKVPEEKIEHGSESKKVNVTSIILYGYIVMVMLFLITITFVNGRFALQCRRNREYQCKSSGVGLPVYRLKDISSPFLMGRNIYIPFDMVDDEELRYAVLHEECHYKHGDAVWVVVRYLILAIYFYNPIIWMAFQYSGRDCELACDEEVMKRIHETERKAYGGCLLNAVETSMRVSERVLLSTNMKSDKKLIKARIENIVSRHNKSYMAMIMAVVILIAITCCALLDMTAKAEKELAQEVITTEDKKEQNTTYVEAKTGEGIAEPEDQDALIDVEHAFDVTIEELAPLYDRARGIWEDYGVVVLIADKVTGDTNGAELYYEYEEIENCLYLIESSLASYPEDFFRDFSDDGVSTNVCIQLVGTGSWAGVYMGSYDVDGSKYQLVQIDVNDFIADAGTVYQGSFFCYTLHRVLYCVLDYKLLDGAVQSECPLTEEKWDGYNPAGFEYADYDNDKALEIYDEGTNYEYFVDSGGCDSPTMDRATIFAGAMVYYQDFKNAPNSYNDKVDAKLMYMSECIRADFDSANWPEKMPWEYILDAPEN